MGNLKPHKLVSNSQAVMTATPRHNCASALADLLLTSEPLPQERSLGVLQDVDQDFFTFKHEIPARRDTRRGVLSSVASVFDPLGLTAPFTLKGKVILQEACKNNSKRDDQLKSKVPRFQGAHYRQQLEK